MICAIRIIHTYKRYKMKYQINISQERMLSVAPKAKIIHGVLFDYLWWLCGSSSEMVEKMRITDRHGYRYTWISYDWIIKEIPMLPFTSIQRLTPVINDLERWDLIHTMRDAHQYKFVRIMPKAEKLFIKGQYPVDKLWTSWGEKGVAIPKTE